MSAIGVENILRGGAPGLSLLAPPQMPGREGEGGGGVAEGGAVGRGQDAACVWNQNPSSRYLDFFCLWDGKEAGGVGWGWGASTYLPS